MNTFGRIRYSDLVDIPKLSALMESFSNVIGIANAVIDVDGTVIVHAGWQDACTGFHRVNAETCRRCVESDTSLVESMTRGAPFAVYRCLNGLVDTAAPIVVDGQHVANVFTGQFLTEPPDLKFFSQQARQFGFDEANYLDAISRVPVLPRERVESITRLYAQLAAMLADNGLGRLKEIRIAEKLANLNRELEEKVAERTQAFAESEKRFGLFMDTLPAAAFIKDEDGTTLYANRYMSDVIGAQAWIGKSTRELFPPELAEKMIADDRRALEAGYVVAEEQVTGSDGRFRLYQTHKFRIPRQGQPPLLGGIALDITERKQMEEKIRNLAYFDPLTSLPNRRMLLDRLAQSLFLAKRYQRSLAIMFIDLDNFKKINDTLGHDVGDELLREVAVRLSACMRTGDTVSRHGGDEFIILLAEIAHPDDAALVADKIIKAINAPIRIADNTINVSVSIGIAVYPVNGNDNARELMKKADTAMYAVKKAGRNGYRFFAD